METYKYTHLNCDYPISSSLLVLICQRHILGELSICDTTLRFQTNRYSHNTFLSDFALGIFINVLDILREGANRNKYSSGTSKLFN